MAGSATDNSYFLGNDTGNEGKLTTAANWATQAGSPTAPPAAGESWRADRRALYAIVGDNTTWATRLFADVAFDGFLFDIASAATPIAFDCANLTVDTLGNSWINSDITGWATVKNTAQKARTCHLVAGDIPNLEVWAGGSVVIGASATLAKDINTGVRERVIVDGGDLLVEANAAEIKLLIAYAGSRVTLRRDVNLLIQEGPSEVIFEGGAKVTGEWFVTGGSTANLRGSGAHAQVFVLTGLLTDAQNPANGSIDRLTRSRRFSALALKSIDTTVVTDDEPIGAPGGGAGGVVA